MAVPDCPALHSSVDEESLIKQYFDRGYTYKDIRAFLEAKHGIVLSEDQLPELLKRRGSESSQEDTVALSVAPCANSQCVMRHAP